MPNWCNNDLVITGDKATIKSLWGKAQEVGFLQALHPMPETMGDEKTLDIVMPDWYSWRVNNWGTKWEINLDDLTYTENGNTATISGWFESAWAPPVGAFLHFAELNPSLSVTLYYHESGVGFVGKATAEAGETTDDCYSYHEATSENVRDLIGEELDEMFNISEELAQYEEEVDQ